MRAKLMTINLRCKRRFREDVKGWDAMRAFGIALTGWRLDNTRIDAMQGRVLYRTAVGPANYYFRGAA